MAPTPSSPTIDPPEFSPPLARPGRMRAAPRSRWALALLCAVLTPLLHARLEALPSQSSEATNWMTSAAAIAKARKEKLGILYYLGSVGEMDAHEIFSSKPMAEQSRRTPVVRVSAAEAQKFREEYVLPMDQHSLVVTDWYGNAVEKFAAKKAQSKLPISKVLQSIASAERFHAALAKQCRKQLERGNKQFEKEAWRAALKSYGSIAQVKGIEEARDAREQIDAISKVGMKRLEEVRADPELSKSEALKLLRTLAREFEGCDAGAEARRALEELAGGKETS